MFYIGADIHSKRTTYQAINPSTGEVRGEHRVPNELLTSKLALIPGPKQIVLEAGRGAWMWRERLSEIADEVWVVSPQDVRRKLDGEAKTDRKDAQGLARLAMEGRLRPLWVPDEECMKLRNWVRSRWRLVGQRTATKNAMRALVAHYGFEAPDGEVTGKANMAFWKSVTVPEHARALLEMNLEQVSWLTDRIDQLEGELARALAQNEIVALLKTIPGVGTIIGATFYAEIGQMDRFQTPDHLVGYSGLKPKVEGSNDKLWHGRLQKYQGNKVLRTAAIWAAQQQHHVKKDSRLKRNYWRMVLHCQQSPNVAKVDTARKVLHAVYWVWSKRQPYRPFA